MDTPLQEEKVRGPSAPQLHSQEKEDSMVGSRCLVTLGSCCSAPGLTRVLPGGKDIPTSGKSEVQIGGSSARTWHKRT